MHLRSRSVTTQSPRRVAVVVGSPRLPRWVAYVLDTVQAAETLRVELLLSVDAEKEGARTPALFRLLEAGDRRLYANEGDALAAGEPPTGVAAKPVTRDELGRAVAGLQPDVVLAFCPLSPSVLALAAHAQHGLWTVLHEGDPAETGGWLGHALREPASAVETRLERRLGPAGARSVLSRSFEAVDPVSLHRTRSAAAWKGAHLVTRALLRLSAGSPPEDHIAAEATPSPTRRISSLQAAGLLAALALRLLHRRIRERLWWNQWFVAYRLREGPGGLEQATLAEPPPRRSLMDPFLVEWQGEHVIFVEDLGIDRDRAGISYLRLDGDGRCSGPFAALEADHHLSYPFVFEWEGELYMLPETASIRAVKVYRSERFPDSWRPAGTLLDDLVAVDPTLCEHGGRLWLFANVPDVGVSVQDELHLFYSDSLFGTWHAHPRNPVVSDVRRARPAGRLFVRDGLLIRPGQDSSRTYGGAVVFNRVDVLTVDDYAETPVGRIDRDWCSGNLGTHCYSADSIYEAVDARRRRLRSRPRRRGGL